MSEFLKPIENPKKPVSKPSVTQNFQGSHSKVQVIQNAEEREKFTTFFAERQIKNSKENYQKLKSLLQQRQAFDNSFSLEDFTDIQITSFKSNIQKENWKDNKSEALTAESLVNQWQNEGFSNYEVLQKLLKAHEAGQVQLLAQKYQQFKDFLGLLSNNEFGSDTKQIISVINQSDVDWSSPKAFDQVVFRVFEDDTISEATKLKLSKTFGLKPIRTGNDLRTNIYTRQKQIAYNQVQQAQLTESLHILHGQIELTEKRLKDLKAEILAETDFNKKLDLEKRYDELETLLKRLKKDTEIQETQKTELQSQKLSDVIFVRGVEAQIVDENIVLHIPKSETKVTIPEHLSSKDIAKVVNAHLMFNLFQTYGLESFLFDPSDFDGDYPSLTSLNRNNAFLHKFGVSYDGAILKVSELKGLRVLISKLMLPDTYSDNLTLKENATNRLQDLWLLADRELNYEQFQEKILLVKQFGKTEL